MRRLSESVIPCTAQRVGRIRVGPGPGFGIGRPGARVRLVPPRPDRGPGAAVTSHWHSALAARLGRATGSTVSRSERAFGESLRREPNPGESRIPRSRDPERAHLPIWDSERASVSGRLPPP